LSIPATRSSKVTSCAICGSDLHLFHNLIPAMLPGDIMGHESMGEVVEVGSAAKGKLKKGDRVVARLFGLPRGTQASRGLARKDFETPPDYRAEGTVAAELTAA
jgi:threonine dehydrogenase-like Zn-dependent dehydrogenase